jgi:hypothetical protein
LRKLRITGGQRLAVVHAPPDYLEGLGQLPEGVSVSDSLEGEFDIVHGFYFTMEELEADVQALKAALDEDGILWVSYPKRSAKTDSDLSRDIIWAALGEKGQTAVAQVSVDEVWSAMRFKRSD